MIPNGIGEEYEVLLRFLLRFLFVLNVGLCQLFKAL